MDELYRRFVKPEYGTTSRSSYGKAGPVIGAAKRAFEEAMGEGYTGGVSQTAPAKPDIVTPQSDFSTIASEGIKMIGSIITPQSDFSGGYGAGGSVMSYKKKSRKYDPYKAKKNRLLNQTIRRVMATPPFLWNNSTTWYRSWCSGPDSQGVALVWINSYRGSASISPSTLPGTFDFTEVVPVYEGPSNDCRKIRNYVDGIFHPNGSSTNVQNTDWAYTVADSQLDLTLTNQGGNANDYLIKESTNEGPKYYTSRSVEYELYFFYPSSTLTKDQAQTLVSMNEILTRASAYEQAYGDNTSGTGDIPFTSVGNPSWEPQVTPFLSKFLHFRSMGKGYLPLGGSVRIHKSFKPSLKMTKQIFDADGINTSIASMPHKPGYTAGVMVVWRGTPSNDTADLSDVGNTSRQCFPSRLGFTCTNLHKYHLDGNVQSGGRATNFL